MGCPFVGVSPRLGTTVMIHASRLFRQSRNQTQSRRFLVHGRYQLARAAQRFCPAFAGGFLHHGQPLERLRLRVLASNWSLSISTFESSGLKRRAFCSRFANTWRILFSSALTMTALSLGSSQKLFSFSTHTVDSARSGANRARASSAASRARETKFTDQAPAVLPHRGEPTRVGR
jgi:hypothetical protein